LKADGVDVHQGNKDGATPMFVAAGKGLASVVALLEEKLLSIEFLSL